MAALSLVPLVIWWFRYREPEADARLSPQELRLILADRKDARIAPPSFAQWGGLFDHGYDFHTILAVSAGFALLTAFIYGVVLQRPIQHAVKP